MMELSSSPSLSPTFATQHNDVNDDNIAIFAEVYNPYVISLIPKIPALISIICAVVFIQEVLTDMKTKPNRRGDKRVIPNMLLALSVSDVSLALAWFLGPWLAPKDLRGLWGNIGNTATCTFVGVLTQFGMISSSLCNVGLSLYYLLIVNYNWRDARRIERFEKWVHLFIWMITLPLTFLPIVFDMYGFDGSTCWISESQLGCDDDNDNDGNSSSQSINKDECVKGYWAWIIIIIALVIIVGSVFVCSVIICIIYKNVRVLEDRISLYSGSIQINNQNKNICFDCNRKTSNNTNVKTESYVSERQIIIEASQERYKEETKEENNVPNNYSNQSENLGDSSYCYHEESQNDNDESKNDESSHMDGNETQEYPMEINQTTSSSHHDCQNTNSTSAATRESTSYSQSSLSIPNQQPISTVNTYAESLQIQAQQNINREKSKRVALQGMWYIAAFLLTYALAILVLFLYEAGIVFVPLDYASYVMLPLQGFFSFIAFCRNRNEMKTKGGKLLKRIIFFWVCCQPSTTA